MIAADHDRRFQFAARDEIVEREAEFVALAIAEPADARGQALKADALLRELDPAAENFIVREHLQHEPIGAMNVGRLARKRDPAERPASFAKQRANVGGNEAGEVVGVLHALLEGERANVVAVIECHRAEFLERQHALDVPADRFESALAISGGIGLAKFGRLRHIETLRNVAADWIVRAGLVGEQIGDHAAPRKLGNHVRAIADQPDRRSLALAHRIFQNA